jgi:hypothetical protein
MVNFIPLNIKNESSLAAILSHIDNATQYAENLEPREPTEHDEYNDDEDEYGNSDLDNSFFTDNFDDDYESNLDNID